LTSLEYVRTHVGFYSIGEGGYCAGKMQNDEIGLACRRR